MGGLTTLDRYIPKGEYEDIVVKEYKNFTHVIRTFKNGNSYSTTIPNWKQTSKTKRINGHYNTTGRRATSKI